MPNHAFDSIMRYMWMVVRVEKRMTAIIANARLGVYKYSSHCVEVMIGSCSQWKRLLRITFLRRCRPRGLSVALVYTYIRLLVSRQSN